MRLQGPLATPETRSARHAILGRPRSFVGSRSSAPRRLAEDRRLRRHALLSDASARGERQRRYVHPRPSLPALLCELGELHALGPFEQRMMPWRILDDVAHEHLPLRRKPFVDRSACRAPPASRHGNRRSASRPGFQTGRGVAMRCWILQLVRPGDRRAVRPVDLEGDEIVAIDARLPGGVDMRHDVALQQKVA